MRLTVMLDIPPEREAEFRRGIEANDAKRVRDVLSDALAPTVSALLQSKERFNSHDEWEDVAAKLVETVSAASSTELPILSEYATSRAGIYEDEP